MKKSAHMRYMETPQKLYKVWNIKKSKTIIIYIS